MLRNKQTRGKDSHPTGALGFGNSSRTPLEGRLLDFLDSFDFYLFLYDPSYRRRLNEMLDLFTDEEFEDFARAHSHHFTVN